MRNILRVCAFTCIASTCLFAFYLAVPVIAGPRIPATATPTPGAAQADESWAIGLTNLIASLRSLPIPQSEPQPTPAVSIDLSAIRARPQSLHDDFEEEEEHWTDEFPATLDSAYEQGALVLSVDGPFGGWCLRQDEAAQVDDFLLEVDARHDGGSEYSFATFVLFRYQDPDNYYLYTVDFGGTYMLERRYEGDWRSLIDFTESTAIHTGEGASNRLGVLAKGETIVLLVNDTILATVADKAIPQGFIGLGIGTRQDYGLSVAFDQLDLWRLGVEPGPPAITASAASTPKPPATPVAEPTAIAEDRPTLDDLPIDWRAIEEQFEITNRRIEEVLEANMAVPALFVYFDFESVTSIERVGYQAAFINDRAQIKDVKSVSFYPDRSVPLDRFTFLGGYEPGVYGTARFELPRDAAKYYTIRLVRTQ